MQRYDKETAPHIHNGVFADLRTVVLFYDKFNNAQRTRNPETGKLWNTPEVDALVAFMKTLTDQRYEHLLK